MRPGGHLGVLRSGLPAVFMRVRVCKQLHQVLLSLDVGRIGQIVAQLVDELPPPQEALSGKSVDLV